MVKARHKLINLVAMVCKRLPRQEVVELRMNKESTHLYMELKQDLMYFLTID